MFDLVIEVSQQAQSLQPPDRARLAELLSDSINPSTNTDIEAAWYDEILRRIDELDQGVAKLTPAAQAFAQVRHDQQRISKH